jgi:transmembrane sensor
MKRHSRVEDEAAEWLARRDSGHWSEEDEARLQQWIGGSTARRVAYLRLKSTWDAAARLRALRVGTRQAEVGKVPAPGKWRRSPFFARAALEAAASQPSEGAGGSARSGAGGEAGNRRRHVLIGIAASVLFVVAVGLGGIRLWDIGSDRYTTPLGGLASVPMEDGSNVTLNTDSSIRVAMTQAERRVELDRGEAFFDVAKDPARPFVVRAGTKRIVAVGTKFSVQNLGEDIRVLVTEGKVRVEDAQLLPVLVAAGSIASASGSGVVVTNAPPPQVEDFLSWREGYLTFHETTLADAVEEMNRYNKRKIFIDDPNIAALRISGTFRPTQYEAFVRVLEQGLALQARDGGDRITLAQDP